MKKLFKDSRFLLKILSALIAVILWFAITYTEDPIITQVITGVNVEFLGEDDLENNGLIVTNKKNLPDIAVSVRGTRSNVISAIGSITAQVDVSDITRSGSNDLQIKYLYPTTGVTLVKSRTDSLTIETEKLVTRSIPVRIDVENADKNTDLIVKSVCTEDHVKVRGAESAVYGISYGKATVDVSGVTASSTQDYVYNFYDEKNNRLSGDNILYKSSPTIPVENTVYKRLSVPVQLIADEASNELYSMTVKGQSATSVDIGVEDGTEISALIAVITREEGKTEYEAELTVPDGVYLPEKSKKITAVCLFETKQLTEITVPVTIENVPEGKTATIEPAEIEITIKCAGIPSPDKITATADAEGLDDGAYSAEVSVTAEDGITVIGAYTATLKIK